MAVQKCENLALAGPNSILVVQLLGNSHLCPFLSVPNQRLRREISMKGGGVRESGSVRTIRFMPWAIHPD